jgi:hypothetical protein
LEIRSQKRLLYSGRPAWSAYAPLLSCHASGEHPQISMASNRISLFGLIEPFSSLELEHALRDSYVFRPWVTVRWDYWFHESRCGVRGVQRATFGRLRRRSCTLSPFVRPLPCGTSSTLRSRAPEHGQLQPHRERDGLGMRFTHQDAECYRVA